MLLLGEGRRGRDFVLFSLMGKWKYFDSCAGRFLMHKKCFKRRNYDSVCFHLVHNFFSFLAHSASYPRKWCRWETTSTLHVVWATFSQDCRTPQWLCSQCWWMINVAKHGVARCCLHLPSKYLVSVFRAAQKHEMLCQVFVAACRSRLFDHDDTFLPLSVWISLSLSVPLHS